MIAGCSTFSFLSSIAPLPSLVTSSPLLLTQSTAFRPALAAMVLCTLVEKSTALSPCCCVMGSRNQTSQTTHQEVISLVRCWAKLCSLLFQ